MFTDHDLRIMQLEKLIQEQAAEIERLRKALSYANERLERPMQMLHVE